MAVCHAVCNLAVDIAYSRIAPGSDRYEIWLIDINACIDIMPVTNVVPRSAEHGNDKSQHDFAAIVWNICKPAMKM